MYPTRPSVDNAAEAVSVALLQYRAGTTDFTTVTQVEQVQVLPQDTLAQAQGEIAAGLIQVYRALGGGWQIRLQCCQAAMPPSISVASGPVAPSEPIPFPPPSL